MILTGYQALHESAALLDLEGRGLLRAKGADRARFLHAMCTNHIEQMQSGDTCYAFFLNAQGRILADTHILCVEDALFLDTEPVSRRFLLGHLDNYIIADDVTMDDSSDQYEMLAIEGPKSAEILENMGAPKLPEPGHWVSWQTRIVSAATVTGAPGYRFIVPSSEKNAFQEWLTGSGTMRATPEEARIVRIENARPRFGEDFGDAQIPHETRLLHAIHFTKGCYLGQEIVERVRSRGHPNRMLCQLRIDSKEPPAHGAKIGAGGRETGEISSAAYAPAAGTVMALGYVRAEQIGARAALEVGGNAAQITDRVPA